MIGSNDKVCLHIYHTEDNLGKYGITMNIQKDSSWIPPVEHNPKVAGHIVCNTFGWSYGNNHDLTIRIDCPEIGK